MMTREQAAHLLDAYVHLENYGRVEAMEALREVILDQMTDIQLIPPALVTYGSSGRNDEGSRSEQC